jgi:lipoic acid synthetase
MLKPAWLNKKINPSLCRTMKKFLRNYQLNTVCEESLCPNIEECFKENTATFMILGKICTRNCSFCAVKKEKPLPADYDEPARIASAVRQLRLKYVVITSPTRDDLRDGGADLFYLTVEEIKKINNSIYKITPSGNTNKSSIKVEILVPDFLGKINSIEKISLSRADVISHNLETVPSLYKQIRSQASYKRSLGLLEKVKNFNKIAYTKSGLMLGLGEEDYEIEQTLKDLRSVNCDFLTLGQYLAPTRSHYEVKSYISEKTFLDLKNLAYSLGFKKVQSSAYSRSSYLASQFL